jgi:hypothetical protein
VATSSHQLVFCLENFTRELRGHSVTRGCVIDVHMNRNVGHNKALLIPRRGREIKQWLKDTNVEECIDDAIIKALPLLQGIKMFRPY